MENISFNYFKTTNCFKLFKMQVTERQQSSTIPVSY